MVLGGGPDVLLAQQLLYTVDGEVLVVDVQLLQGLVFRNEPAFYPNSLVRHLLPAVVSDLLGVNASLALLSVQIDLGLALLGGESANVWLWKYWKRRWFFRLRDYGDLLLAFRGDPAFEAGLWHILGLDELAVLVAHIVCVVIPRMDIILVEVRGSHIHVATVAGMALAHLEELLLATGLDVFGFGCRHCQVRAHRVAQLIVRQQHFLFGDRVIERHRPKVKVRVVNIVAGGWRLQPILQLCRHIAVVQQFVRIGQLLRVQPVLLPILVLHKWFVVHPIKLMANSV